MAKTNYRGDLKECMVRPKIYFYVLLPLLAAKWMENTGSAAPIEFDRLSTQPDDQPRVLQAIHTLLEQKGNTPELGMAEAVPEPNEFIEASLLAEVSDAPKKSRSPHIIGLLNEIFHGALQEHADHQPFPTRRR